MDTGGWRKRSGLGCYGMGGGGRGEGKGPEEEFGLG